MKTIKNKSISFAMVLTMMSLSSCSDFLDKEPLSEATEASVFNTADQFDQAANALYTFEGWKNYTNNILSGYRCDQNTDISGLGSNGGASAPESDTYWDKPYSYIRNCNILLQKVDAYTGDKTKIKQAIGTAYFMRAWYNFMLLKRFGGVPIDDHVLTTNDKTLYAARNSRYEVFSVIKSDLENAIDNLTKESEISNSNKGKVSKEAAQSFLARTLLFEATWEKYVPSIGYDLDGDGTKMGAGTKKPEGYPSVTEMLTEAKTLSGSVIDEASAGTFKLWNECDSLSYYYLFNLDDKGGNITNFKGAGKSTNKEFILSVKYDYDLNRGGVNLTHTVWTWQLCGISSQFASSFLCRNGLPIRLSKTGNMTDAYSNPEFLGYSHFTDEYRNRDYRFLSCTYIPDRVNWMTYIEGGIPYTSTGNPYPTPVYPKNNNKLDLTDPAYSSKVAIFHPSIGSGSNADPYGCIKFAPTGANRVDNTESADYPLIRLAEVYLIYAEATCELGNGQISDNDLNYSINKLRARARVAPLTNALIQGLYDANYFDNATGKTICKKMNMLDEIRRERACELFGEGFRYDDLRRWGIAQTNLTGQKLGRHILGTAYETEKCNDATYFGQTCYNPSTRPLQYGIYEGTGKNDPDYGRSIATKSGNLLYTTRDYLEPLPKEQIRLNPQLLQNPGW